MARSTNFEVVTPAGEPPDANSGNSVDEKTLRAKAAELAGVLAWLPNTPSSQLFPERSAALARTFKPIFSALQFPPPKELAGENYRWLYDNERIIHTEAQNTVGDLRLKTELPHVRNADGKIAPRSLALAEGFLQTVSYEFAEPDFVAFVEAFQETTVLQSHELPMLVPSLKLLILERIAASARQILREPQDESQNIRALIRSLQDIVHTPWHETLELLNVIDRLLREDPAGAYAEMDSESRQLYRRKLTAIAEHSDFPEIKVAERVVKLARDATRRQYANARIALRESHVGYYLVDKGSAVLEKEVGFRLPFKPRLQRWVKSHPDEFILVGIALLTLVITSAAVYWLTDPHSSLGIILLSLLIFLLPSSQSAVQLMNYLVTTILPPEILPKLDWEEGVPNDCVTMVAVPTLLLSERQVRELVDDLEVRFLGNHDPNIHFALLSDLPDSREPAREDSPLITLCSELIEKLNQKYASRKIGSFFLFHRHRIYNPREKAWMGWERKRGKLLDFNKLLRGRYDAFPVKIGNLEVLPRVRYVITLDSDTELPRGAAQRLIGTLAHPLNQAIIDAQKNIVIAGYGILQPRVGVSVQSTARSRLAAIFAGETGIDIYTRAISDAYQDLYGEGSYTGKGIYEVDSVLQVLDRRFPRNSLLSHDLIEGAYARAGLVSDIEVIEGYPSHYSAYNRRKHRWLRGDWQVAGWLFPFVPSESLDRVPNPISLLSRWKIFDNLRRSLIEPATFLLFLAGWFSNEPGWWTLAALLILFLPTLFQFAVDVVRALMRLSWNGLRDAANGLYTASANVLFTLIFLPHQTLLSLDAVIRALVRRFVTQRRLLEWETAAEAELATRRGPVDTYLIWTPILAIGLGILVWAYAPPSLPFAVPILALWASSKFVASWLNRPPVPVRKMASPSDVRFLRRVALLTWRYFAEFSSAEHNWLIPDNVVEEPLTIAARVSPTNIGLLLNARQVACEFGYLTVPEFAERTLKTLGTISALEKYRGHLLNWYDTRTLQPMSPRFASSVDSGNMLASLWTLEQGCVERLRQPILQPRLAEGFSDYLRLLSKARVIPRKVLANFEEHRVTDKWLSSMLELPETALTEKEVDPKHPDRAATVKWFQEEAQQRLRSIRETVEHYAPWFSPEFAEFRSDPALNAQQLDSIPLERLPEFIDKLSTRVDWAAHARGEEQRALSERFREKLLAAKANAMRLITDLQNVALLSSALAESMDFGFMLSPRRKLLSVGYHVDKNLLEPACYDLLATESRTAIFVSIAKEDISQETWFQLGRPHTLDGGRPVLLSWSGTTFEYLMPSLWMRSYHNTLLERSRVAAVRSQQEYAAKKGVPWGISESAHSQLDDAGNFGYYAFGLPTLAMHKAEVDSLVISPYSTLLSLTVDPEAAIENLRTMGRMGWFGPYGFYESADFSVKRSFWRMRHQIVRCWMAHHQGMSLLALANFLNDNIVQKWFHAEPRVQATELLLHEKPVARIGETPRRSAAA